MSLRHARYMLSPLRLMPLIITLRVILRHTTMPPLRFDVYYAADVCYYARCPMLLSCHYTICFSYYYFRLIRRCPPYAPADADAMLITPLMPYYFALLCRYADDADAA